MSENDPWFFTGAYAEEHNWGPPIRLRLERYGTRVPGLNLSGRHAVLLLHGASANHRTFLIGERAGLAQWLLRIGLDPWLLDWRGSSLVVDDDGNRETLRKRPDVYTLSHAAGEDVTAAILRMRRDYQVQGHISLLGHCMGSAVIAEAVALGHLQKPELHVDRVVLLALGLFYESPIDGRLKSEERVLERLVNTSSPMGIDPRLASERPGGTATEQAGNAHLRARWPNEIQELYDFWPHALQFHRVEPVDTVDALCNRVAFMYGMPYHEPNLIPAIHVGDELEKQFGGIPLHLYLHCARNLRRGQAIVATPDRSGEPVVSEEGKQRFLALDRVTLITGALNRLWHRDSIDRMYEWLTRGRTRHARHVRKYVLEDYAHQDLLWGSDSPTDVYPKILEGVRGTPETATSG